MYTEAILEYIGFFVTYVFVLGLIHWTICKCVGYFKL